MLNAQSPAKQIVGSLILSKDDFQALTIAAERNALDISRVPVGEMIESAMRLACPVSGDHWDKFMTVLLQQGKEIKAHKHKRHTMLFYPDAVMTIIAGRTLVFSAGALVYIPPGVEHSVPPAPRTRLSVAMLISDQNLCQSCGEPGYVGQPCCICKAIIELEQVKPNGL